MKASTPIEGFVYLVGLCAIGAFILWLLMWVWRLLWLVWEMVK